MVIYEEAVKHQGGYEPDNNRYYQMTDALLKKYPYLKENSGEHARDFWKKVIKEKFRNTRKRGDRNVEEVQAAIVKAKARKEKRKLETYHSVSKWGIVNYKPLRCKGETDESI